MTKQTNTPTITGSKSMAANVPTKKAAPKTVLAEKAVKVIVPTKQTDMERQMEFFLDMVRHQNDRLEAAETSIALLTGQCTTLESIIVGIQTATLQGQAALKIDTVDTSYMASDTHKNAISEVAADSLETVMSHLAECVVTNRDAGYYNVKIQPQTDVVRDPKDNSIVSHSDLRVFLRSPQNKTLKIARIAAGITLADAVRMLQAAVNG